MSPGRLDEIESRLALIERLKRKYGATVEEVLAFGERCRARAARPGSPEERERALGAGARARWPRRYLEPRAAQLSRQRRTRRAATSRRRSRPSWPCWPWSGRASSVRFDAGRRRGRDDASAWTRARARAAEFLLSPNPGEELRPLARIASGGELSRILLALKSVASLRRAGQDARLRRGGRRDRRARRRGRGPQAARARRAPAGPLRHPPAADRVARRSPPRGAEARRARADRRPRSALSTRRSASRRSRGCWAARRSRHRAAARARDGQAEPALADADHSMTQREKPLLHRDVRLPDERQRLREGRGPPARPTGYERAAARDDADFVFINTCAVREKAAEKLFHALGRLQAG